MTRQDSLLRWMEWASEELSSAGWDSHIHLDAMNPNYPEIAALYRVLVEQAGGTWIWDDELNNVRFREMTWDELNAMRRQPLRT